MRRRILIALFLLGCAWVGTRAGLRIAESRAEAEHTCSTHAVIAAKQQRGAGFVFHNNWRLYPDGHCERLPDVNAREFTVNGHAIYTDYDARRWLAARVKAKQQQDRPEDCERLKKEGVKGCNRKSGCKCRNTQCGDGNEPEPQEGEDTKCIVYCCKSLCRCHVCP